jgi:hypothetical protein
MVILRVRDIEKKYPNDVAIPAAKISRTVASARSWAFTNISWAVTQTLRNTKVRVRALLAISVQ